MEPEEKLRLEKELLGLYLSDHPLRRISTELALLSDIKAVEVTSALQNSEVRVAGLVREVRRVVTRKGQIMGYATIEDLTGTVDVVLFPRVFEQVRLLFELDNVVVVAGKVDARAGSLKATATASGAEADPESELETASVVADMAWKWDDPECQPIVRQLRLNVSIPNVDFALAERLESLLEQYPGTDQVVINILVGNSIVEVDARYRVKATEALRAEVDQLVGRSVTTVETIRPKAQSNGNSRGKPSWR
jgi:DNA polymerase-3 subunit alpha